MKTVRGFLAAYGHPKGRPPEGQDGPSEIKNSTHARKSQYPVDNLRTVNHAGKGAPGPAPRARRSRERAAKSGTQAGGLALPGSPSGAAGAGGKQGEPRKRAWAQRSKPKQRSTQNPEKRQQARAGPRAQHKPRPAKGGNSGPQGPQGGRGGAPGAEAAKRARSGPPRPTRWEQPRRSGARATEQGARSRSGWQGANQTGAASAHGARSAHTGRAAERGASKGAPAPASAARAQTPDRGREAGAGGARAAGRGTQGAAAAGQAPDGRCATSAAQPLWVWARDEASAQPGRVGPCAPGPGPEPCSRECFCMSG